MSITAPSPARVVRKPWLAALVRLLLVGLLAYAGLIGVLYFKQETLLFRPTKLPVDHRFEIPGVTEVSIPVEGAQLSALHFKQPNPKGVVFFLHGNGGSLREWLTSTEFYRRTNYDLFMIDYRGYGKSTGSIESEAQLHADVRKAWDFIAPQYAGKKNVIFGRSLGTGLATKLASEVTAAKLVLVSPYQSIAEMARAHYPFVPQFAVRYPIRTDAMLPTVKIPTTILHGSNDDLIPFKHAETLKALAPAVNLIRVDGAGHNDLHRFPHYLDSIADALGKL